MPRTDCGGRLVQVIDRVNGHWQRTHPEPDRAFWHPAVYHTGNMEAYRVTGKQAYLDYSVKWAEHNRWMGARSNDRARWRYSYGERDRYVLFGDWQVCFQTYIDLYNLSGDESRIARAREVMEYQMSTEANDYLWWADGLYMVLPVMTKLYHVTGNGLYLDKAHDYYAYAKRIMYDQEAGLFFRDAKYVYPKHTTAHGAKDFWARGNGWVLAALARVLADLPPDHPTRPDYEQVYQRMAGALAGCQQDGGYWTRSLHDPEHAPGYETSGTALMGYGYLWGINHGQLDRDTYLPVASKAWRYLADVALQADGDVGYVQPIGERAIPGQVVDADATADFGVGAFLLAASEMFRLAGEGS